MKVWIYKGDVLPEKKKAAEAATTLETVAGEGGASGSGESTSTVS